MVGSKRVIVEREKEDSGDRKLMITFFICLQLRRSAVCSFFFAHEVIMLGCWIYESEKERWYRRKRVESEMIRAREVRDWFEVIFFFSSPRQNTERERYLLSVAACVKVQETKTNGKVKNKRNRNEWRRNIFRAIIFFVHYVDADTMSFHSVQHGVRWLWWIWLVWSEFSVMVVGRKLSLFRQKRERDTFTRTTELCCIMQEFDGVFSLQEIKGKVYWHSKKFVSQVLCSLPISMFIIVKYISWSKQPTKKANRGRTFCERKEKPKALIKHLWSENMIKLSCVAARAL